MKTNGALSLLTYILFLAGIFALFYNADKRDDRAAELTPITYQQIRTMPLGSEVLIESRLSERNEPSFPEHDLVAYIIERSDSDESEFSRYDQSDFPLWVKLGDTNLKINSYTLKTWHTPCISVSDNDFDYKYRHCGLRIGDQVVVIGYLGDDFTLENTNIFLGTHEQVIQESQRTKSINQVWGPRLLMLALGILVLNLVQAFIRLIMKKLKARSANS